MDQDHNMSNATGQSGTQPPLPELPPLPLDEVPFTPSSYLPADELICEFVHSSMVTKTGVMVNFINHNCPDAATVIGGIRLRSDEIARIPAIIARHFQSIKLQAAFYLRQHLNRSQSALAAVEEVTVDDFSLSFMLASVSEIGRSLHPTNRNEGPLHFSMFPKLCKLTPLGITQDGEPVGCYVVNAYIHLLDAARRRTSILKKQDEDRKRKKEQPDLTKPATETTPASKKPKFQIKKQPLPTGPSTSDIKDIRNTVHQLAKEVKQLNLPTPQYPSLPTTSITWPPVSEAPPMPEGL